jgi:hypothetical protein
LLTELHGKGGTLCSASRAGQIRCPLIVRPTSEDVITGEIFQALGYLNPRWWLPDLLNLGLGTDRFRRQVFRDLEIRLWRNQPCYPRELLPWDEGSTQVDAVITWENPPTTVFIEAKYLAGLSATVSGDDGSSGYPSDQLIRNIRVGLHRCGYFRAEGELFTVPPRDLVVLVLSPGEGHPLVERYRDDETLRSAIPHSDRLIGLPPGPFVGELTYGGLVGLLRDQARWFTRPERQVVDDLTCYLEYKLSSRPDRTSRPRHVLPAAETSLMQPLSEGPMMPIDLLPPSEPSCRS